MAGKIYERLINGSLAGSEKITARCLSSLHPGYLTDRLTRNHHCIEKNCAQYCKLNQDYWEAKGKMKQDRVYYRSRKRFMQETNRSRDTLIRETLQAGGHVHVTSIREKSSNRLVISYIYDRQVDLSQEIALLREKLRLGIMLKAKVVSNDVIEALIRKPRRETGKVTDLRKAPKVGVATKRRLEAIGVYCLEDLWGRNGDALYQLDCKTSGKTISQRFLTAYRSAVAYANERA